MSVDPEIFAIFQHKVEQIPHFARVTEVRHIYVVCNFVILPLSSVGILCGYRRFFETPEVSIIGIFVLLKYENKLELITSDINFNSVIP